jgi:hypothetical protein
MVEKLRNYDVIVDFWEWYQHRQQQRNDCAANYALDKCEETFARREWEKFGYWHKIYLRERRMLNSVERYQAE